jgi:GDP-L-fucose synthase
MKRALLTGITDHDDACLAGLLLAKSYQVHGIKRRSSSFNTERIDHPYQDPHENDRRLIPHYGDVTDATNRIRIRGHESKTPFCQASTTELCDLVTETPQSGRTPSHPRLPCGVAKLYAYWVTVNCHEDYGRYASNGIIEWRGNGSGAHGIVSVAPPESALRPDQRIVAIDPRNFRPDRYLVGRSKQGTRSAGLDATHRLRRACGRHEARGSCARDARRHGHQIRLPGSAAPRMTTMRPESRIDVAGHRGMVGSAIVRRLRADGFTNLVLRAQAALDLTDQGAVDAFFASERPEYVLLAAAKVGGIHANSTYPADFIRDNVAIQTNVVHSPWKHGARKLLFLDSSCIYPRDCPQPIKEEYLLTGPLEPTNEWYAIAKIAGIKPCQAYRKQHGFNAICAMPTNLYGPGDNYHPENSRVVPALIRWFHEAKLRRDKDVVIWGTGTPLREFLHVDDLADACLLLMQRYSGEQILNVGSGDEVSIARLAQLIAEAVDYRGRLVFDASKPDGAPRKLLDADRLVLLGFKAITTLPAGLNRVYMNFLSIPDATPNPEPKDT